MENLFSGEWTSNDFLEVRTIDSCKARIVNSVKRAEHSITVQQKSPSIMKIQIENESRTLTYSLELLPRDMITPLHKQASLLWLKLLFGKALKGETKMSLNFLTNDDIKVNSIFLSKDFEPRRSVSEEDAAAILFTVCYDYSGKTIKISLQVPKILEDGWAEGSAPIELENWSEPSDLYQKNQRMQEMINSLQQETQSTYRQFQKSQQEILNLKSELSK